MILKSLVKKFHRLKTILKMLIVRLRIQEMSLIKTQFKEFKTKFWNQRNN